MTFLVSAAVVSAVVALVVDAGALAALYDVGDIPDWLAAERTHDLATALKTVAFAVFARQTLALTGVFKAVRLLAGFVVAALALAAFEASGLPVDLGGFARTAAAVVLWILVAAGWMYASGELSGSPPEPFHGYRQPLAVSSLIIGIAMLAYVFDTPRLLGHLLFDVSLLGTGAAAASPSWTLSAGRRLALYTTTLTIPAIVYVSPFFLGLGAILYENREQLATLAADVVEVETAESLETLLDESLVGYQRRGHTPILNDVWLFADGRALAIDEDTLFERESDDGNWMPVRELPFSTEAEYLHFDRDGGRGVIGAHFENPLMSVDGGRTWSRLDRESIVTAHLGHEPGGGLFDNDSVVFLDPESGAGSFVTGCRFFATENFGESWTTETLTSAEDRDRCPAASPFAVDPAVGLARGAVMGSEFLLSRAPDGRWSVHCLIDFEAAIVVGSAPSCEDDGVLTEGQARFVGLEDEELVRVRRQLDDEGQLDGLVEGGSKAALGAALRENGARAWLSGPGYLLLKHESGRFVADVRVPRLDALAVADARHALGVARGELFTSDDSGRVWRRLAEVGAARLLLVVPGAGRAYLASELTLYRWDADGVREVASLPEGFEPLSARSSPDGTTIAISGRTTVLASSDGDRSWRGLALPRPEILADEDGDPIALEVVSVDCSPHTGECVAVYDDGSVLAWPVEEPQATRRLPPVPTEDGYAWGVVALLGAEPTYIYLPSETSRLNRSTGGDAWSEERVGLTFDERPFLAFSGDGRRLAVQQAAGQLLVVNDAGGSYLFDESDWREWADDVDHVRLCWTTEEKLALLTNPDARLAVSQDVGASWRQASTSSAFGSACGASERFVWLLGDGLSVYESVRP